MGTKEQSKNALYFVFKRLYLKNEPGDPQFFIAGEWLAHWYKTLSLNKFSGADS